MSVTVKNIGPIQAGSQNQQNTGKGDVAMGDQGTVRVVVEGIDHVFGPNDSKTFGDDGIGIAVAAADARLRVMDSRDGAFTAGVS